MEEKNKISPWGTWSFFGTFILLILATYIAGVDYRAIFDDFFSFLGGNFARATPSSLLADDLLRLVAIVIIELPIVMFIGICTIRVLGKPLLKSNIDEILDGGARPIFFVNAGEEIIARWIPLGLLWPLFGGGTNTFLVLFLAANTIWALIHLSNYKAEVDRNPIRVIPQFISGIILTYVFVRYGLAVTILVHYSMNVLLFATRKEREPGWIDVGHLLYYSIITAVVSIIVAIFDIPVVAITKAFLVNSNFDFSAFSLPQLIIALTLGLSILELISSGLLLDRPQISEEYLRPKIITMSLFLYAAIIFCCIWFAGLFTDSVVAQSLAATFFYILLFGSTTSGSMLARRWFIGVPSIYILFASIIALGWTAALAILPVATMLDLPMNILDAER